MRGAQNLDMAALKGVLASIMGSTNMTVTMDDFDAAARVLHEAIPEEANIVCGLYVSDPLGDNLKVTVFATYSRIEPSLSRGKQGADAHQKIGTK
jgi:cell division GTPase FtsZ